METTNTNMTMEEMMNAVADISNALYRAKRDAGENAANRERLADAYKSAQILYRQIAWAILEK